MVGKRLAELRKAKGLTQEDLANELSLVKETISNYEREVVTPSDEVKAELAHFFNVSLDYLFGLIDKPDTLDRNDFTLPIVFSSEWIPELEEHIKFIIFKNSFDNRSKDFVPKWANLTKDKQEAFLRLMQED